MNNQIPFFYPFNYLNSQNLNNPEFDKLKDKIEYLEKAINNLEVKIKKIEKNTKIDLHEETDMYII